MFPCGVPVAVSSRSQALALLGERHLHKEMSIVRGDGLLSRYQSTSGSRLASIDRLTPRQTFAHWDLKML